MSINVYNTRNLKPTIIYIYYIKWQLTIIKKYLSSSEIIRFIINYGKLDFPHEKN